MFKWLVSLWENKKPAIVASIIAKLDATKPQLKEVVLKKIK